MNRKLKMNSIYSQTPQAKSHPQAISSSSPPTGHGQQPSMYPPSFSKPSDIAIHYSYLFTMKRLLIPLLIPPVVALISPHILSKIISILNLASNGCALFATGITFILTRYVHSVIRVYAPDEANYNSAISQCTYKLEMFVFGCVCFILRSIAPSSIFMIGKMAVESTAFGWIAGANFMNVEILGKRVALGMLVLSILIGSRFVGYFGIAQCSTFPLPNNPYIRAILELQSIPLKICQPQPTKSKPYSKSSTPVSTLPSNQQIVKRYTKPSLPALFIQIVFHSMVGFLFALFMEPSSFEHNNMEEYNNEKDLCQIHQAQLSSKILIGSCTLASTLIFISTYYSTSMKSNYHELSFDKKMFSQSSTTTAKKNLAGKSYQQDYFNLTYIKGKVTDLVYSGLFFYWIISPLFTATLIYVANTTTGSSDACTKNNVKQTMLSYLSPLVVSYIITFFMTSYMVVMDVVTRTFLFTRGVNIDKLVTQSPPWIQDDKEDGAMDNSSNQNGKRTTSSGTGGRSRATGGSSSNIFNGNTVQSIPIENKNDILVEELMVSVILAGLGMDILDDVLCPRISISSDGLMVKPEKRNKFERDRRDVSWMTTNSTNTSINFDLEEEEVRRNDMMMDKVATGIVTGAICGNSSFEVDVFKIMVLESLGGEEKEDNSSYFAMRYTGEINDERGIEARPDVVTQVELPLGLSQRHYAALMRRIDNMNIQIYGQPSVVPVVRALCAYSGGIGEGLRRIAAPAKLSSAHATASSSQQKFSLPSCASLSGAYAIVAATRLVILNSHLPNQSSNSGVVRKRFNRLSLFVPVVLQTIYKLRCGALDYAASMMTLDQATVAPSKSFQLRGARTFQAVETLENFIAVECPEIAQVIQSCDDSALKMVQFLKKIDGPNDAVVRVDEQVKEYLNQLL